MAFGQWSCSLLRQFAIVVCRDSHPSANHANAIWWIAEFQAGEISYAGRRVNHLKVNMIILFTFDVSHEAQSQLAFLFFLCLFKEFWSPTETVEMLNGSSCFLLSSVCKAKTPLEGTATILKFYERQTDAIHTFLFDFLSFAEKKRSLCSNNLAITANMYTCYLDSIRETIRVPNLLRCERYKTEHFSPKWTCFNCWNFEAHTTATRYRWATERSRSKNHARNRLWRVSLVMVNVAARSSCRGKKCYLKFWIFRLFTHVVRFG